MTARRKNSRIRELGGVKVGFFLDAEVTERLRDVAFFTRESQSQIVGRLIREYVDSAKFRHFPRRPRKPK